MVLLLLKDFNHYFPGIGVYSRLYHGENTRVASHGRERPVRGNHVCARRLDKRRRDNNKYGNESEFKAIEKSII